MKSTNQYLLELRKTGDRLLLVIIGMMFGVSLALAPWYGTWSEALAIGLPTVAICAWMTLALPGTLVARCTIAAALMVMTALQIHQSHGMIETHFAVFVLMSCLLFYRDWIPIVVAAGTIAVHHVAFDLLQRAGHGVWVFGVDNGFGVVLIHAAYVIFESMLLIWMALKLRAEIDAVGYEPRQLASVSHEIAQGNVDVEIPLQGAGPESLAYAMVAMRDELKRTVRDTGGVLQAVAGGDLSRRAVVDGTGEFGRLRDDVNTTVSFLSEFSHNQQSLVEEANAGNFRARCSTRGLAGYQLDMANGLNQLMTSVDSFVERFAETLGALAEGDLSQPIRERYPGRLEELRSDTNRMAAQLTQIVGDIRETTQAIGRAALEIVTGHTDLDARIQQQSLSLKETKHSTEQLASAVKSNAESASQANQLSVEASQSAGRGVAVVSQAVETMQGIRGYSSRIADITGVIEGIAFQTNLLALNAAVEAARAGEQGRGFAIVAIEVRGLAKRAADAAREISQLITESVDRIDAGGKLVDQAGVTMGEIVARIERVTTIVKEIATASHMQANDVASVNRAVAQIDDLSRQNAEAAKEAAQSARSMAVKAEVLRRSILIFKLADEVAKDEPEQIRNVSR